MYCRSYSGSYTKGTGNQVDEYEARQQAYEQAVAARDELINNPEKNIPVIDYIAHLADAKRAVTRTHKAMLAAWTA